MREIITDELERFRLERSAREVAPLVVVAARPRRGGTRRRARTLRRPPRRARPGDREAVEALTRGIVNKLLHDPTVRVKEAAGTARGELYADALAELFDLDTRTRRRSTTRGECRRCGWRPAAARSPAGRPSGWSSCLGVARRARDRLDPGRRAHRRARSTPWAAPACS